MDDRKLLSFIASAEEKSFEKAAERCNTTQTSISRHVAALENEIGVKLFDRNSYRAKLTDPGRRFYEKVKKLYEDYERAVEELRRESEKKITIGISGPIDMKLLPRFIHNFQKEYPDNKIEIKKKTLSQLEEELENSKLDIIFGLENEFKTMSAIQYIKIFESKLCVMLHENHPLKRKDSLTLGMLLKEEFIVFSSEFSKYHYQYFINACKKEGFTPKITKIVDSLDEMILQVSLGQGIAIVSEEALNGSEPVLKKELLQTSLSAVYCMAYKQDRKPMIDNFINQVKTRY